jgi:protein-tyrosine-phosphatase
MKRVLFVCIGNINRSQIAEAIFNELSKENKATSAGLKPRKATTLLKNEHNNPVLPMKEFGYDLSKARVKKLSRAMVHRADKVVCVFHRENGHVIPKYLQDRSDLEFWDIHAIKSETPQEEYLVMESRRIKMIESYVKDLVTRLG